MKIRSETRNTTSVRATLTLDEIEAILAAAVLQERGLVVPEEAMTVTVSEKRNERVGTAEPVSFVVDVTVTIDNTKLPVKAHG